MRLAAAGAALLLTLAGLVVLVLGAVGAPLARGPLVSPPATETARPSRGAASPQATPQPTRKPDEILAQIEEDVQRMRGLPDAGLGRPDIISRGQLAAELERIFDEELPPAKAARDNLTLRALGLLSDDQDIRTLMQRLYEGQVLGFYDSDRERMVIVSDAGLNTAARVTYAHEYTHALQDAAFDIDALQEAVKGEDDQELARIALIEGDASYLMSLWAAEHLGLAEMIDLGQTELPDLSGIPAWTIRQLEFPYLAGTRFVGGLWSQSESFAAVDDAFALPPASTEQVLHPAKFRRGEEPMHVPTPRLVAQLRADTRFGWRLNEVTTLGEEMIAIWLEHLGVERATGDAAAAGWGGDRLVVARGPSGSWALAWRIAWDSEADADAFAQATAPALDHTPGATRQLRLSPREFLIVRALDQRLLGAAIRSAR
jgi:hypothetical protein